MNEDEAADLTGPENIGNSRAGLKGWAYVEDWMVTLDKGMVDDFNEDINTLLTFAGLFSAVLAGFLVQLYVGLQPSDNQATNNLLTQISLQMGQMSQQLANNSLVPVDIPVPSPSFDVSASIVWINCLWFLSLVLSLAAALFGMISKQWLREYLQWTTMSGLSEKQVGLRQGRYEAFMEWKTPAVIASMPVLLEFALILFLLGMEVLLWTLNTVVFSVCTVAVVTLILLVFVVTVLPAFRARCPYKSPVGWAVLLVRPFLYSLCNRCLDLIQVVGDSLVPNSFHARQHHLPVVVWKDWRQRDLAQQTAKISELEDAEEAAAVGRHQVLVRALWWIRQNSQDQRLIHAVHECVATFVTGNSRSVFGALAADLHFACECLGIDPTKLVPPENQCAAFVDGGQRVISNIGSGLWQLNYSVRLTCGTQWEGRNLQVTAPASQQVWIAHLLFCDLLAVLTHYNDYGRLLLRSQTDYVLQASLLLSGYLAFKAMRPEDPPSAAVNHLVGLVDRLCRDHGALPPCLKHLLPLSITLLDICEACLQRPLTLPSAPDLPRTHYALNTPPGPPADWTEADCAVFTHLFQSALREWRTAHDLATTKALLSPLLERMAVCVRRCHEQQWVDCAVPSGELVWLWRLNKLYDPEYSKFLGEHLPVYQLPYCLLDALLRYKDAGLVSDPDNVNIIEALAERSASLYARCRYGQASDGAGNSESQLDAAPRPIYDLPPSIGSPQSSAPPSRTANTVDPPQPVRDDTTEDKSPLSEPSATTYSQNRSGIHAAHHDAASTGSDILGLAHVTLSSPSNPNSLHISQSASQVQVTSGDFVMLASDIVVSEAVLAVPTGVDSVADDLVEHKR